MAAQLRVLKQARLPEDTARKLAEIAERRGISENSVIIEAIDRMWEVESKKK